MRIVLDTNVVFSAVLWQGTPHQLLATIQQRGDIQLITTTALLEEFADVLSRPSATKRLAMIGRSAREVLTDYVEATALIEPSEVLRVVVHDTDDDQVIAAAVASRAELIVSGDRRHLLPLGSYQGIDIVEPAEALRRLAN